MIRSLLSNRIRNFSIARRSMFSQSSLSSSKGEHLLTIQPEVQQALEDARPVVALESTIVAHGMPFPENLELAQTVEDILRSKVSESS